MNKYTCKLFVYSDYQNEISIKLYLCCVFFKLIYTRFFHLPSNLITVSLLYVQYSTTMRRPTSTITHSTPNICRDVVESAAISKNSKKKKPLQLQQGKRCCVKAAYHGNPKMLSVYIYFMFTLLYYTVFLKSRLNYVIISR